MPSCSQPSRTLRAAEAVARRGAILDRRCARRHIARAGRDGRMVPIEQMDWTEEDRASKLAQHHPLDSTKRLIFGHQLPPFIIWCWRTGQDLEPVQELSLRTEACGLIV